MWTCEALATFANNNSANTTAAASAQSSSLWRALRCHLSHGTTCSQFEFCENLWCWQCDETALYLRVRTLCRRFCRFIEPLLQSRPLRPFISYRTFYLRFMEHAIRPDILRSPNIEARETVFFLLLSYLIWLHSSSVVNVKEDIIASAFRRYFQKGNLKVSKNCKTSIFVFILSGIR